MSVNKLLTSLHVNRYGVYYLRFRVSNKLRRFFKKDYISKSLFTKTYKKAQIKAMVYRSKYIELLEVSEWLDDKTLQLKVTEYMTDTLKIISPEMDKIEPKENEFKLKDAFRLFDKWYKKQDISDKQYNMIRKRIGTAIAYFGEDRIVKELTTDDIEKYVDFLSTYPNPNRKPYKTMSFKQIVRLKDIPQQDYISPSTAIKYVKAFQQLENFLIDDGKIDRKISKRAKLPTPTKISRNPFTDNDLKILFNEFDNLGELGIIYYTFAYSGMRTAEFWKCKIGYEDDIYYFDLSYEGLELKTYSSKRKIPIHSKLIEMGILNNLRQLQKSYRQAFVSDTFNKKIINTLKDRQNKVMYGFRHTVGTKLKRADVEIDKISEILGHSYENTSMTKTVYTNGYSLKQLKEAIEYL